MREQINNNPMVQIGLIAILAIAAALMLLRGGGDDSAVPAAPAAGEATAPAAGSTAAPAPGSTVAPTVAPDATGSTVAPSEAIPPAPAQPPAKLVPGRGLPESFVKAYADNQVVVLLFSKKKGLDDKVLRKIVAATLGGRDNVKLFVERPKHVSRYSRVTQGVDLDRVPALIVVKPRSRTDNSPVATVSYGVRGPKSVVTAIEDALYEGGQRTAAP